MNKKVSVPMLIFIIFLVACISFSASFAIMGNMYGSSLRKMANGYEEAINSYATSYANSDIIENSFIAKAVEKLSEIDAVTRQNYIGELNEDELLDLIMQGYVVGINDRHASYLSEKEFEASTQENFGHSVGIGVSVFYDNTVQGLYVINVNEGQPAEKAGVLPGDIIVAVDGETVMDAGYYGTINKIKNGEKGEGIVATVLRFPDYNIADDIKIVRDDINIITVKERMIKDRVGYVQISEFNRTTSVEFIQALQSLKEKGAEKFIFDVRNNPGGDLIGISEVLDYLLPKGPIIRIVDKNNKETTIDSDRNEFSAPIVVLCNGNTASAAELFTSALMDYKKATVVGTVTYGKGTMQTVFPLKSGGGISVSTAYYNPPFSDNYDGVGITPDVEIEMPNELMARFYKLTDSEDNQLAKAIEIIDTMK